MQLPSTTIFSYYCSKGGRIGRQLFSLCPNKSRIFRFFSIKSCESKNGSFSYSSYQSLNAQNEHESNYSRLFTLLQLYSDTSKIKTIATWHNVIDSMSGFISLAAATPFSLDLYDKLKELDANTIENRVKILRILVLNDKQVLLNLIYLPLLCKGCVKLNELRTSHPLSSGECSSFVEGHISRIESLLSSIGLEDLDEITLSSLLRRAIYNSNTVSLVLIPALEYIPQHLLTPKVMEAVLKQALRVTPPRSSHSLGLSKLLAESEKSLRESSMTLSRAMALQGLIQLQSNGKFFKVLELASEYYFSWYSLIVLSRYKFHSSPPMPQVQGELGPTANSSFSATLVNADQFFLKLTKLTMSALLHTGDVKEAETFLLFLGNIISPLYQSMIASVPIENLRGLAPLSREIALNIFCVFCDTFKVEVYQNPMIFDVLVHALSLIENTNCLTQKNKPISASNTFVNDTQSNSNNNSASLAQLDHFRVNITLKIGNIKFSLTSLLDDHKVSELIISSPSHRQSIIRSFIYQAVPRSLMGSHPCFFKLLQILRSASDELKDMWISEKDPIISSIQKHLIDIGDKDVAELLNYYGKENQVKHGLHPAFSSKRISQDTISNIATSMALGLTCASAISIDHQAKLQSGLLWQLMVSCFTKVFMLRSGFQGTVCRFYNDFKDLIPVEFLHFHSMAVLLCSHLLILDMNSAFSIANQWLHGYSGLRRKDSINIDTQKVSSGRFSNRFLSDLKIIEDFASLKSTWTSFIIDFERRTNGRTFPSNEESSHVILELLSSMNIPIRKDVLLSLSAFLETHPKVGDLRKMANELHTRINLVESTAEIDSDMRRLLCLVLAIPVPIAQFRHKFFYYLFERKEASRKNV